MKTKFDDVILKLYRYDDPIIDFKIKKDILKTKLNENEEKQLYDKIKNSCKVKKLLSEINETGIIPFNPYSKWFGAHWILTSLAEINYPQKEKNISGLINQVYEWLSNLRSSWKVIKGKIRTHPCILGNAVYYISKLGFIDKRINNLIEMIMETRWNDGGWNCDPKPRANISSIATTRLVLRGLNEYNKYKNNIEINKAINESLHLFTDREIFLTRKTKKIINHGILELSYPEYYHYNTLSTLMMLMDIGYKNNSSLDKAMDSIEKKELATGGYPAERKRYVVSDNHKGGSSPVGWGIVSKNKMNEYVTANVLAVLKYYNRI